MEPIETDTVFRYIAANVQRLRVSRGLTQDELAAAADVSLTLLHRLERAKTNVSVAALVAIANALGVTPAALFRPAAMQETTRGRPRKRPAGT
ncbi:helix-turn-helix domain-containing protein [Sorangium sp. So ce1078]|uniref:helix-turn-helix domain-containing protein n=1 Tax=Sorangium sp. So ce1078 TaxID=3133329 RepID=UPI003F631704